MNPTDRAVVQPTPLQRELLGLLFEEMLEHRGGVPYYKFRSVHVPQWAELDGMEAKGWLKRDNDHYYVQSTTVPLIDTPAARERLENIERIYAALRAQYLQTQLKPYKVTQLAEATDLAPDVVLEVLRHMMDTVSWHLGSSLNVALAEAFVSPGEKILQFSTFAELAADVRSWQRGPTYFPGTLVDDMLPVNAPVEPVPTHSPTALISAWPPARTCLQGFPFDEIKDIAGLAGFDVTAAADLVQRSGSSATKGQLLAAIDRQLRDMDAHHTARFLAILMEEMLSRDPEAEAKLSGHLSRLGWSFIDGKLLPLALFDANALEDMPADSHPDLLKAAQRLRDGDLGGAISAAAGAVDAAVAKVYQEANLGDPTRATFQEGCKRAMAARGILVDLERRLADLEWQPSDAGLFARNLEGALGRGAYVMQTLRSHMGDVHGSKPILRALVFDSLRWAELLVGALVVKADPGPKG
jgi:hypothetical protein